MIDCSRLGRRSLTEKRIHSTARGRPKKQFYVNLTFRSKKHHIGNTIHYKISSLHQSQGYDLDGELEKHKKIETQKIKAEIKLGKEENVHRGFFKQYKTLMFEKDGKESTVDVLDIRVKIKYQRLYF